MPLLALTVGSLYAQTGTIVGIVTDASGAVVPGAAVHVTQAGTSVTRDVNANASGAFQIVDLAPGTYSLKIRADGFKASDVNNVQLSSGETRDLGKVELQLGAVSDSVSVSATAIAVETASSQRSATIDGAHLKEVGLKGRDVYQLLDLIPGAVDTSTSRDISGPSGSNGLGINGMASRSVTHTLDGMQNEDNSGVLSYVQPNLDAIAEVRIQSASYQAEYGRSGGGSVNLTTKSGTEQFHGTFHWDHRNEDLNANSFFNNRTGVQRPPYRFMIIGYSFGGPLNIPKKKTRLQNRLFFFASEEWSRTKIPATVSTANLPTAAERAGDFSGLKDSKGNLIQLIDPSTRKPIPGNIIPAAEIDPIGQQLLNLQHMPTGYVNPAPGQQYTANSLFTADTWRRNSDFVYRMDANITRKMTAFFRGTHDTYGYTNAFVASPGVGQDEVNQPGKVLNGNVIYVFSPTFISETMFGYGENSLLYTHQDGYTQYFRTSTFNPPSLFAIPTTGPNGPWEPTGSMTAINAANGGPGAQGFSPSGSNVPMYLPYLPKYTAGGGNSVGEGNFTPIAGFYIPYVNITATWNFTENLTKIIGNHRIKAGIYIDKDYKIEPNTGNNEMGNFNFASSTNNPLDSGDGYANMMLGVFQTYDQHTGRTIPYNYYWQDDGYIQDSWHTKRLNIDVGLRIVHQGAQKDNSGNNSNFFGQLYTLSAAPALWGYACNVALVNGSCPSGQNAAVNPLTGQLSYPALVGTIVNGSGVVVDGMHVNGLTGHSDYFSFPMIQFAPRLGFAWDATGDGKTAIRASVGTFYNRGNVSTAGGAAPPVIFDPQVLYSYVSNLPTLNSNEVYTPTAGTWFNPTQNTERLYQITVGVQRQLWFGTVLDVAWVANLDRDANYTLEANPVPYLAYANPNNLFNGTEKTANLLRTNYPGMGSITYSTSGLTGLNYHALQVSANRRLAHGVFFGLAYTFSKALGEGNPDPYHTGFPLMTPSGQTVTLANNRQWNYGPTAQDRTHVLAINASYALPRLAQFTKSGVFERVAGAALGGWTVTAISLGSSGAAYSPTCSSTGAFPLNDPTETGQSARCQEIANPRVSSPNFYQMFNTAAFTMAPTGTFGNTGVNILRNPFTINLDLSLDKSFMVKERLRFRIRAQAFNALNHTEFNSIGSTYSFNAAGVNTNTTTGQMIGTLNPRQMALSIRAEF